jgi:hypothetical protein
MERFFSTVKCEIGERFEIHGDARMQLFDYIEARRISALTAPAPYSFCASTRVVTTAGCGFTTCCEASL